MENSSVNLSVWGGGKSDAGNSGFGLSGILVVFSSVAGAVSYNHFRLLGCWREVKGDDADIRDGFRIFMLDSHELPHSTGQTP